MRPILTSCTIPLKSSIVQRNGDLDNDFRANLKSQMGNGLFGIEINRGK